MQKQKINIWWARKDLRIDDNMSLFFCSQQKLPLLPIYIFEKEQIKKLGKNNKRINFIFQRVLKLKELLQTRGADLAVFYGNPGDVFHFLIINYRINDVYASVEDYTEYSIKRDKELSKAVNLKILNDRFIFEPDKILSQKGTPYKIFTHFKNAVYPHLDMHLDRFDMQTNPSKADFPYYKWLIKIDKGTMESLPLDLNSINFVSQNLHFEGALKEPIELLKRFESLIDDYSEKRDFPVLNHTSLLSAHLSIGSIGVREIIRFFKGNKNIEKFTTELLWREFFQYILFHFPYSETENLNKNYRIKWLEPSESLCNRITTGNTGIPLIDAGIRQLIKEGFMHNRVRMIMASYLTKDLKIDWRWGEKFFAEHLIDYEPASNIGNWQWNAGVGADPRGFYRKFNPQLQAKKFDPQNIYIARYLSDKN